MLSKLVRDPSPRLDRDGGKFRYGKDFENLIASCLEREPGKRYVDAVLRWRLMNRRPNAEKLLLHPFFKLAKKKSHLVSTILTSLPPLEVRQQRCTSLSVYASTLLTLACRSSSIVALGRANRLVGLQPHLAQHPLCPPESQCFLSPPQHRPKERSVPAFFDGRISCCGRDRFGDGPASGEDRVWGEEEGGESGFV